VLNIVDLDKFQPISHLIITHAAGRGGRAGDGEVVWGGGMDKYHPGDGRCWGLVKNTKIG
jgi:hypothetical protein